ncbi:armadillo-type protein [Phlebopus sp. FC_14]|nr:armadillo-type protein [Phlebopus sp. FC_14]
MANGDEHLFRKLKPVCVSLLEKSQLTPANVPAVLHLLATLEQTLVVKDNPETLSSSLVSYVFFPLSTILRRNASSNIPDQVLEKLFSVLTILCGSWWWDCDLEVWSQIFVLCSSIVGDFEGKGKTKARDDESKEAAARCLWSLLRERDDSEAPPGTPEYFPRIRLAQFQTHAQTTNFIPIVGKTLDVLLFTAKSAHRPLQRVSLRLLDLIVGVYACNQFLPSVLPGVVSTMTRVALGTHENKGWANSEAVAGALSVLQKVVVLSIGDTVCIADGAIHSVVDLEDFAHLDGEAIQEREPTQTPAYFVARTATWLRASSSQLHIALNTLSSLVNHPTPSSLTALASMAKEILRATSLALPQSQPLLLSWLLSLSNSPFPQVADVAFGSLVDLLTNVSNARQSMLQAVMNISKDSLSSLPRAISSQADSKVEHIAGLVEAICRLATSTTPTTKRVGSSSISDEIDLLLGPGGGIEKWGWTLLSVLEFRSPAVVVDRASVAQLFLEGNPDTAETIVFPEVSFMNVLSRSTGDSLARMFRALSRASGDNCLYAVEWFVGVGCNSDSSSAVAALWCAGRLLEGMCGINLDCQDRGPIRVMTHSKKLEKFVRGLARDVAELWTMEREESTGTPMNLLDPQAGEEPLPRTEFRKGIKPIRATLEISESWSSTMPMSGSQPLLHKSLCLHLLAISAGILQSRFTPLLINVLYPILHSLVSPVPHCSLTALATLHFITDATSYASPANLLLSHFDYALDGVSRHLGRRWLDIDATKVLAVLVRLVGGDVVQKAGDVIEECFDRLDEYHGYEVVVEGLVEVLVEVIKVIEVDTPHVHGAPKEDDLLVSLRVRDLTSLFAWATSRNDVPDDYDATDYGPAPRQEWGYMKPGEEEHNRDGTTEEESNDEPPLTSGQALTKQMVSRSIYFLTHESPIIRARILSLLCSATPVLSESTLLPSIHQAWPYVLNRLGDPEIFVVSAATALIEALIKHVGSFMGRRVWEDVWPRFSTLLKKLEIADGQSALTHRGPNAVGTESAYSHSHRLYRSILRTMTAAVTGVHMQDFLGWEVILAFRRFLHREAHEELQARARELYTALGNGNEDAVWLALMGTSGQLTDDITFLREPKWDISDNVALILTG